MELYTTACSNVYMCENFVWAVLIEHSIGKFQTIMAFLTLIAAKLSQLIEVNFQYTDKQKNLNRI